MMASALPGFSTKWCMQPRRKERRIQGNNWNIMKDISYRDIDLSRHSTSIHVMYIGTSFELTSLSFKTASTSGGTSSLFASVTETCNNLSQPNSLIFFGAKLAIGINAANFQVLDPWFCREIGGTTLSPIEKRGLKFPGGSFETSYPPWN